MNSRISSDYIQKAILDSEDEDIEEIVFVYYIPAIQDRIVFCLNAIIFLLTRSTKHIYISILDSFNKG